MPPLPKTQKVLQITRTGGPEVLEYADAPLPTLPPNHLLVKNTYSGVNYIDTYFRTGLYPPSPLPYTLGREGEGHVVDPGTTAGFAVGDYIAYLGPASHAQYTAVDSTRAIRIPAGVPPGHAAAALLQGLTALTLIREACPVPAGEAALVHAAAGGVGGWLCALLKAGGVKVVATAGGDEKGAVAKRCGAGIVVDYTREDWVEAVKALGGVVAVFDGVGKETFDGGLEVLKRKGCMVSFGNASGAVPPVSIARLSAKNLKLLRPSLFPYLETREEFIGYAEELMELVVQGKVEVRIHKVYELKDGRQAQEDLESRKTMGKLLYKIPE